MINNRERRDSSKPKCCQLGALKIGCASGNKVSWEGQAYSDPSDVPAIHQKSFRGYACDVEDHYMHNMAYSPEVRYLLHEVLPDVCMRHTLRAGSVQLAVHAKVTKISANASKSMISKSAFSRPCSSDKIFTPREDLVKFQKPTRQEGSSFLRQPWSRV